MDYITRKSCVKQYGSVGAWTYAGRGCPFPCISALGVRNPNDKRELNEALNDLDLPMTWENPAEVEATLANLSTPEGFYRKAKAVLNRLALKTSINAGRRI